MSNLIFVAGRDAVHLKMSNSIFVDGRSTERTDTFGTQERAIIHPGA
jgi:hypothetical protein